MSSRMIKRLPYFMQQSKVYSEIFKVEENEFDNVSKQLKDIEKQFSVDTATWGLEKFFEKELGIKTDKSKSLQERRSVIKSRLIGFGKVDIKLIKLVAESFNNGDINVQYGPKKYAYDTSYYSEPVSPPYPIVIQFVDSRGVPSNIEDLKQQIENIKPAHIRVEYKFRYLTWSELDKQNLTWDQLDSKGVTWDEFETGQWIIN